MGDSKTGDAARRGMEVVGAAAGGAAGLVTGDPSVGFVATTGGTFLGGVFGDMVARHISKMEARRLDTVAGEAARLIKANIAQGRPLRHDGFFDEDMEGRSRAHEIAEAAFGAAMRSYEEKKIPYIAHLLAEAAFAADVDAATLNWALDRAQDLTWTQYLLLAVTESEEHSMPVTSPGPGGGWKTWGVHRQLADLGWVYKDLEKAPPTRQRDANSMMLDRRWEGWHGENEWTLLYRLLGLEQVDPDELSPVLHALEDTRPGK